MLYPRAQTFFNPHARICALDYVNLYAHACMEWGRSGVDDQMSHVVGVGATVV